MWSFSVCSESKHIDVLTIQTPGLQPSNVGKSNKEVTVVEAGCNHGVGHGFRKTD